MKLTSKGPSETEDLGYRIGQSLRPGSVVKLYGDLGAGKTTMVRGIARAFGIDGAEVISPSFTIITEYASSPRFFHVDLYRVTDGRELESTGFWDCVSSESVAVIEWPEHAEEDLPADALSIRISHKGGDDREIEIEGMDEENRHNL